MLISWIKKVKLMIKKMKMIFKFKEEKKKDYRMLEFAQDISQARREWVRAQNYYDNVLDEDLVDHAAYTLKAAEKKYAYLFKLAKREGIRHYHVL